MADRDFTPAASEAATFCDITLSEAPIALRSWLGDDGLRRNIEESIERGHASRDRRRLLTANGRPVVVAAGEWIDAMEIPHLLVMQRSFHVRGDADLVDLASLARDPNAPPARRIGVYVPTPLDQSPFLHRHASIIPYKRYLVTTARTVLEGPTPVQADRLKIVQPADFSFYDDYSRMYDDFHDDVPELVDHVKKETPEDLAAFGDEGRLSIVQIDGRLAGVMAAVPACEHGLRGWMMKERIFSREFRGGGFGPAALWAFFRSLPLRGDDLVWGTIVPENHASIRSALKLGRVDIGGWYWIDVDRVHA